MKRAIVIVCSILLLVALPAFIGMKATASEGPVSEISNQVTVRTISKQDTISDTFIAFTSVFAAVGVSLIIIGSKVRRLADA